MYIYIYTVTTSKHTSFEYTNSYFRLPPEGFPWPAWPFKHTEPNLFEHTFKNTDGTGASYYQYLRDLVVWPALHI